MEHKVAFYKNAVQQGKHLISNILEKGLSPGRCLATRSGVLNMGFVTIM